MKKILLNDIDSGISICRVSSDVVVDLRHRILRAGMPAEAARFPGDDEATTWHAALFYELPFNENAPLVSCASFMLNSYQEAPAWQLRGMATDSLHQGKGFGGRLLVQTEAAILKQSPGQQFWCNARVPAIRFYEQHGWKVDSEVFDIPTAGPHRKMVKRV